MKSFTFKPFLIHKENRTVILCPSHVLLLCGCPRTPMATLGSRL